MSDAGAIAGLVMMTIFAGFSGLLALWVHCSARNERGRKKKKKRRKHRTAGVKVRARIIDPRGFRP